jgi:segregation and condensation protein A
MLEPKPSLEVKLPAYEGPLDLLLELIKKNEMDIYNIPIAEITRQYLECLERMQELNLDVAGDFLVMAATLLYIKSRMLLPDDGLAEEDEEGQDPRAELVRKLLEYQAFREVARELGLLEQDRGLVYTRRIADYIFHDLEDGGEELEGFSDNLYDLLQAFYKVLQSVGREGFHEVFEQVLTLEQMIEEIKRRFEGQLRLRFSALFQPGGGKLEIVVTFLALLELVKQRWLRIAQKDAFGEIEMERAV